MVTETALLDMDFSRRSVTLDVNSCLYTKVGKVSNADGSLLVSLLDSLYEICLASGNRPNYLLCANSAQVRCGTGQQLYLKVATPDIIDQFFDNSSSSQKDILIKIGKQHHIKEEDQKEENDQLKLEKLKDDLLNIHDSEPLFYELTTPIPKDDILRLSPDDLQEIVDLGLTDGVVKDIRINYVYRAMVPIVNPVLLQSPKEVMPCNPHTILVTYTKTGKTTTGWKLGTVHDRPTPASLLGFSTAQKGSQKIGALNNAVHLQTIDDISELREGEVSAKGFLNLMEQGDIHISRGYGINTRAYCTLLLTSNPLQDMELTKKSSLDMYNAETIQLFQDIITRIHDNPSAIGSRFGLILFFPEMTPVDVSNKVPYTVEENLLKVLQTLQLMLANSFTRLLRHETIRKWLATNDDQLTKQYRSFISKLLKDGRIKDISWTISQLLDGQKANFCHLRGFPLRHAVMDHLHDLIHLTDNDKFPDDLVQKIITKADEHLKETLDVLVYPSLSNILDIFKGNVKGALLHLHYRNLARYPFYEKVLLHCITSFALREKSDEVRIIPLADLKDIFLEVIRDYRDRLWFNTFPFFMDLIEKHHQAMNYHRGDLQFTLKKEDGVLCVVIPPEYEWYSYVCNQPLLLPKDIADHRPSLTVAETPPREREVTITVSKTDPEERKVTVIVSKTPPKEPETSNEGFETSPKTSKTPNGSEGIGELGGLGVVSESMRTNDEKEQTVGEMGDDLVGFDTVKKKHVEWALSLIQNNPEFPLSAFRLKFQKQWGQNIPVSEIETVYQTVKRNMEQKKKVDKND